jgi:hypothetical protein
MRAARDAGTMKSVLSQEFAMRWTRTGPSCRIPPTPTIRRAPVRKPDAYPTVRVPQLRGTVLRRLASLLGLAR